MPLRRVGFLLAAIAAAGLGGYLYLGGYGDGTAADGGAPIVAVKLPEALSARAKLGREAYDANCAECHGRNATGLAGTAPPLVHVIYEPGHHGDESFQRAVARGVRAHHWRFGNMPPVDGLTRREVADIVAYVRELQRANGIR